MKSNIDTEKFKGYLVWSLIISSVILSTISFLGSMRSGRSIRSFQEMLEKTQPLTEESLELGREINAEMRAVISEEKAIGAELKKPADQQDPNIEERQVLNRQRIERITELLAEQKRIIDEVNKIQKTFGIAAIDG